MHSVHPEIFNKLTVNSKIISTLQRKPATLLLILAWPLGNTVQIVRQSTNCRAEVSFVNIYPLTFYLSTKKICNYFNRFLYDQNYFNNVHDIVLKLSKA